VRREHGAAGGRGRASHRRLNFTPEASPLLSRGALDLIRRAPHHPGMDRRRFLLASLAGVLAAPLAAEGQQAERVYRIGYLDTASTAAHANRSKHSERACVIWATWRGRTSSSSPGGLRGGLIGSLTSQLSWRVPRLTSSWLVGHRQSLRRSKQPRRYPSSWRAAAMLLPRASWRASRDRAATSLDHSANETAAASRGEPGRRARDVPRDGHAVLARGGPLVHRAEQPSGARRAGGLGER
jgi:hypothetical protein